MRQVILALPAFNEAENIRPLIQEAKSVFESNGLAHQILVVNDGSTDSTAAVLSELEKEYGILVITHEKNSGLGEAILTGIESALKVSGSAEDIVVNMDADNTHSPAYIPGMCARIWEDGYDIVIASRFRSGSQEVGVPVFRRLLSRGARVLFRIFLRLPDIRDYTCGYRAYRITLLSTAMERHGRNLITRKGFACTDELLVRLSKFSKKMTEVPFVLRYDMKRSRSKLPLFRTIWETLKMLVSHH